MSAWVLWVMTAAVLGIAEVVTLTLVVGLVAVAALAAAAVAALGGGATTQLITFAAASLALLVVVRPIAKRHLRIPAPLRTGVDALVGAPAVVIEQVTPTNGRVSISGDVWSARAFDAAQVIEPGSRVDVIKIEGVTALVHNSEA